MDRIKRGASEYFREYARKVIDAFSNAADKGVYIEVEIPVSNEELCKEIRLNIEYLKKIVKEAEKRGLNVVLDTGGNDIQFPFKYMKVNIYETKRY